MAIQPGYANELADQMDSWDRQGSETDEPEGSRYVVVSDTLLRQIAHRLRHPDEVINGPT